MDATAGVSLIQTGTLAMELASAISFDTLSIAGQATLGGTLEISLHGAFNPSAGDVFDVLTAADGLGGTTFTTELLPALTGDLMWNVNYGANSVSLEVLQSTVEGDFDGDGFVTGADFLKWQRGESPNSLSQSDLATWEANYSTANPQLAGDFDGNGDVNGFDFLHWQRDPSVGSLADWEANYGTVATLSATAAAVPEPTTSALTLAALCLAMSRRWAF